MASLNRVEVIGNLGRDPEIRYTPSGDPVATFSVAATEKWQNGEHTEWFSVVAWKKLAENCQKYLHKGSQVFIEGKLRTREYEGRDGQKRKVVELQANNVIFLGGGAGQGGQRPVSEHRQEPAAAADPNAGFADGGINDSDIPF